MIGHDDEERRRARTRSRPRWPRRGTPTARACASESPRSARGRRCRGRRARRGRGRARAARGPAVWSRENRPSTMQDDPDQHAQLHERERVPRGVELVRPLVDPPRRTRRNLGSGGLRAAPALALVVAAHAAIDRILVARGSQRSNGHRRALHRAPPGHRAGALPRHARARLRRGASASTACSRCSCWRSRRSCACRCGGRSRWPGCGSPPRSTTSWTRTSSASSSRSSASSPR